MPKPQSPPTPNSANPTRLNSGPAPQRPPTWAPRGRRAGRPAGRGAPWEPGENHIPALRAGLCAPTGSALAPGKRGRGSGSGSGSAGADGSHPAPLGRREDRQPLPVPSSPGVPARGPGRLLRAPPGLRWSDSPRPRQSVAPLHGGVPGHDF